MALDTDHDIIITIGGSDVSDYYLQQSLNITKNLGATLDTASFDLVDYDGNLGSFNGWQELVIEDELGNNLFGGYVTAATPRPQPGGDRLIWHIAAADYEVLMQMKVVDKIYVAKTAAFILNDLFTTYLSAIDAVTDVATGGTHTIRFDRVTLFDAVKMLADVDGYQWWVDADKNLHYVAAASASAAPFNVADAPNSNYTTVFPYNEGSLSVEYDERDIRNRVIVHGGTYASGQTTDTFSGDNTEDTFTLTNRPLRSIIAVLVGGVAQLVGRDWIDDPGSFDVLVNYNYGTLRFATPPPVGTDNVVVIYTYDINIRVTRNDAASQALYGQVFEFVHVDKSIGSQEAAENLADAILNAYAGKRTYGAFVVERLGLEPGQEVAITDTAFGWSAEAFIIQSVTITEVVVGTMQLAVRFGDRMPGFTDIARGFGGGAGGASVGGAGTGGGAGSGSAAYDVPTAPGGLEHVSQNLGIIYVGRAEFLEIGTHFNDWDDYDTASGVVVGYDYINDTGKILLLESGTAQVQIDSHGIQLDGSGGIKNNLIIWKDALDAGNALLTINAYIEAAPSTYAAAFVDMRGTAARPNASIYIAAVSYGGYGSAITLWGYDSPATERGILIDAFDGTLVQGNPFIIRPQRPTAHTLLVYKTSAQSVDLQQWRDTDETTVLDYISNIGALGVIPLDSVTNTHTVVATFGHNSTGTPAASFAQRHLYQLESSTTASQDAAAFDVLWSTATHASRTTTIRWLLVNSGAALAEYMSLAPNMLTLTGSEPVLRLTDTDTDVGDGEAIGTIQFYTSDTSGLFPDVGAAIQAVSTSSLGASYALVIQLASDPTTVTERARFTALGSLFIGDTANANMTRGITINQTTADDEVLAFKSSDTDHGMTDYAETDTYGDFQKGHATLGSLWVRGFAKTGYSAGLHLYGFVTDDNTTKNASASAPVVIAGLKKSGTAAGVMGADANVLVVRNGASAAVLIVDEDGDLLIDGTSSAFDAYDDVALVRALEHTLAPASVIRGEFDKWVGYNRADLERANIIGRGGNFINIPQLGRLHNGAIWQLHRRIAELEQQVAALRGN